MQSLFGGGRSNWFDIAPERGRPAAADPRRQSRGLDPDERAGVLGRARMAPDRTRMGVRLRLRPGRWISAPPPEWRADLGSERRHVGRRACRPCGARRRGTLVTRAYFAGSGWTVGARRHVTMDSSPAAVSPVAGQLDIYYKGADSKLYHVRLDPPGAGRPPRQLPGITNAASGPAVVATGRRVPAPVAHLPRHGRCVVAGQLPAGARAGAARCG